jgi:hypothetical protein
MILYQKTDLLYNDYEWNNTADDVKFQGEPDRTTFTRHDGNDVLYIINFICQRMKYISKEHAGRIEMLIHDKLPLEVKSQKSVFNWIQNNYTAEL